MDTDAVSNAGGKLVTVGLSGGVDSAVAALLLKDAGHAVTGVFMRNWDEDDSMCPADADYEDVRAVADALDIPYYSVSFEREYKERVFKAFLSALRAGDTPNPDVLCNREIKFAAFLDFALTSGADALATGHYARRRDEDGTAYLLKGVDEGKDQSYFLCLLTQEQLRRSMFPLGDLTKPEVRALAEKAGLPVARKKDSTGICFIGERNFRQFLKQYIQSDPGEIQTPDGTVLGRHEGLPLYTLGQRRGLGIGGRHGAGDGRWFVVRRDFERNVLVVDQKEDALYSDRLEMADVSFISGSPGDSFRCAAKVRYRQPDQKAWAEAAGDGRWLVRFDEPQRAISPGQYCVLYDGETCLGGGVIQ